MKIEGHYPTHYLPYDPSLSFEKRVDYIFKMLEEDDPPSFLAAYFNEPDHTGHEFGPNSPEVSSVIRRMDNVTGYLLENLRNRGLLNQVSTCTCSIYVTEIILNTSVKHKLILMY